MKKQQFTWTAYDELLHKGEEFSVTEIFEFDGMTDSELEEIASSMQRRALAGYAEAHALTGVRAPRARLRGKSQGLTVIHGGLDDSSGVVTS